MNEKVIISPYSKVKIEWDDRPENYSKEAKNKIKNIFAKKYGVNKNNIEVIYRPVKFNQNGDAIEITGADIENIMNVSYQRELMKEWLKRENKTVDFDRITKLDDLVNAELNIDLNENRHKSWAFKWITIDNFLSFGDANHLYFNKLKGLTVVNSLPANQGGKTTLTIDAPKFLLHGSTTKTDTNEQIFNTYRDKNELTVRGMLEIDNEELIIERKMKRSAKKGGGWTVVNKVNYYKLLPDGEEELLNDEHATKTTNLLRKTVGSEKDFEMLVLATEKNLDDLIGLTPTESGKILTRLIGLEVLEMKEEIVRKMYNTFNSKKKGNDYDVVTLKNEIDENNEKIDLSNELKENLLNRLEDTKNEILRLSNENDRLLNSKISIDVSITALNPSKLEEEINKITIEGKNLASKITELENSIAEIGVIEFDENEHFNLTKENNTIQLSLGIKRNEIANLNRTIQALIQGGICSACNRKLDDVDNTEHIKKHQESVLKIESEILDLEKRLSEVTDQVDVLNKIKETVDIKNRLELQKDRTEVEIGSLRNKIVSKKNDLKKYKLNEEAIEINRDIDSNVSIVKTNLTVQNHTKDDLNLKIQRLMQDITNLEKSIQDKLVLIQQIKKEEEIEKIYKVYIELVGKKGISKLVLRSVLPIINSELARLLDEVCDFEIEIFIDDKNNVQFNLLKDGISKALKSGSGLEKTEASLALRAVLGKLSMLPMPNFITFDEVLGKIANENLELLKPLFDKIKNMYETVFLITHNTLVKDWGDNIITVEKQDNVSNIKIK